MRQFYEEKNIIKCSAEMEVAIFLHALVLMIKPIYVYELGTYMGLTTCYLGLAIKELGKGKVFSFEKNPEHICKAK